MQPSPSRRLRRRPRADLKSAVVGQRPLADVELSPPSKLQDVRIVTSPSASPSGNAGVLFQSRIAPLSPPQAASPGLRAGLGRVAVIHIGVPPSPEEYLQEMGRAGRRGGESDCLLYASLDTLLATIRVVANRQAGSERTRQQKLRKLQRTLAVLFPVGCRRKALLSERPNQRRPDSPASDARQHLGDLCVAGAAPQHD